MANFRLNSDKTEKTTPVDDDILLIEDSEAAYGVKYVKRGTIQDDAVTEAVSEAIAEGDTRYAQLSDFNDLVTLVESYGFTDVINVVHNGKTTSGLPDFLTYSGLNVSIDTNSGANKLRLNVANGRGDQGRQATIITVESDASNFWTVPSTDGVYQLFIKEDGTSHVGNIDTFYTAETKEPTGVSGQLWYDRNENSMKRYVTAWANDAMTPVGECTVSGSVITDIVCYSFNGVFISDIFTVSTGTLSYTINSKIGVAENTAIAYAREDSTYSWGQFPATGTIQIGGTPGTRTGLSTSTDRIVSYVACDNYSIFNGNGIDAGMATANVTLDTTLVSSADCYVKVQRGF